MTHAAVMDQFYAAREAWEDQAEAASNGYATELAEYAEQNPRPTLKAFLVGLKSNAPERPVILDPRNYPGRVLTEPEYAGCAEDWHEWHAVMRRPSQRATYRAEVRCYADDSWSVTVWAVLAAGTARVDLAAPWVGPELRRWSDDVLQECKYGN